MEIIIGRDQQTRKLSVIKDGKTQLYGKEGYVPMDVSRQHLSLKTLDEGKFQIRNLNEQNVTYVNGLSIESKVVSGTDRIELGTSHFLFPWASLEEPEIETVDIRPLKKIWDDYDEKRIQQQIAERRFNAARSATGIITMLAIACSIILGHGPIYLVLYALAIGISIVFTIKAYNNSTNVPRRQQEMNKDFQRKYVCPKCKHFYGFQDFEIISQNDKCPFCQTKLKK